MEVGKDNVGSLNDTLPSPKLDPRWALISKTTELWGLEDKEESRNCPDSDF